MKHFLVLACGLMLVALFFCKKETSNSTQHVSGSEAIIGWQDCAYFTDHDLLVCFIGANEYRCPCNADCIWEGAVDATFHLKIPAVLDTTITLTTNSNPTNLPTTDTIGGKIIRFVSVNISDCNEYGDYEKYKVGIEAN